MDLHRDEYALREFVSTWMAASEAGDVEMLLSLMTDDVVFLVPGQPVMRKADFETKARPQPTQAAPRFTGTSEIQEIRILGDWAFLWARLTVVVSPPGAVEHTTRTGHTLSIFQKQHGRWLLARDANLLAPIPADALQELCAASPSASP